MKRIAIATFLMAGFGVMPAVADDATATTKPCAFTKQVDHFKPIDDYTAIFDTSPSKQYKVTFYDKCTEIDHSIFARLEGKSGLCVAQGDVLVVKRPAGIEERCMIKSIEIVPPKTPAN